MRAALLTVLISCVGNFTLAQDIITSIAGNGMIGYCCDNEQATVAQMHLIDGVCLDNFGNLYITDCYNNRIRKVALSTGIITTVAGDGTGNYNGDSLLATNAELSIPEAVVCDTSGNIFIADAANNRIRKVTVATGIITTIAGSGPTGIGAGGDGGDGGQATAAQLNVPSGICFDKSYNLYIADYGNNKVRKVDAVTGIITTFAGVGTPGYTGGFVGYSGDGGLATNAKFSGAVQVFADSAGNIYICDMWNNAVRKVNAATGVVTTIAGNGTAGYAGNNGLAINALLNIPFGVFVDKQSNVFIADDGNGAIRRIDGTTGIITTIAGKGINGYSGDGSAATDAELDCADVVLDNYGNMYIGDYSNNRVRMVYNPKLAAPSLPPPKVEVKVYPNPVQSSVTVSYDFVGDGEVQVMNMMGQVMATAVLSVATRETDLDISNLPPGLYLYRVTQNNALVSSGKLIKE